MAKTFEAEPFFDRSWHGRVVDHETRETLWTCNGTHRSRHTALACSLRQRDEMSKRTPDQEAR